MAAMLHDRNNTILFLWDKMFILMQNIFIVPAMQHGRHAKPLYSLLLQYYNHSANQNACISIITCCTIILKEFSIIAQVIIEIHVL